MGTVFTNNFFVFDKAIEGIREFDRKPNRHFKRSQFKIIFSVGDEGIKRYNERISSGKLKLPDNILIRAKVPQLEVLKRADLFITHCGMNSTSESIKYAVPVVAIPLDADQPTNAKRICDELSFGIRLHPISFEPDDIGDAIDRVLSDETFKTNIGNMSKIFSKYNGAIEGAKLIISYLNEKE